MPDISQIIAVSFPNIIADARRPENQWAENAALREMERQGVIDRVDFGEHIEVPLDYRPNPDAAVLATDQDAASMLKTEVMTSAVYDIAQINVPVTWTKGDDAKNPTTSQKVDLIASIAKNALETHDDMIEQAFFTTTSGGGVELNGLDILVPDNGEGTPGGIDAGAEAWWRNPTDEYNDASDIEAAMTSIYNQCAKGSGSGLAPKFLISGSEPHALFESQLQTLQRFVDTSEADAGFKVLAFKNARYVFSQYGDDHIYFLNGKNFKMVVSKQYFRDKGETEQVPGQNAFYFLLYSALQNIVSNKSRLGVLHLST